MSEKRPVPKELWEPLTKAMIAMHRYYVDGLDRMAPGDENNWMGACIMVLRDCIVNASHAMRAPRGVRPDIALTTIVKEALILASKQIAEGDN